MVRVRVRVPVERAHAEQLEQPLEQAEAQRAHERGAPLRRGAPRRGRLDAVAQLRLERRLVRVLRRGDHLQHEARELPPHERRRDDDHHVHVQRGVRAAQLHAARPVAAVELGGDGGGDGEAGHAVEEEVDRGRVALGEG